MGKKTEAVITALEVAVSEAEQSDEDRWPVEAGNRWVNQFAHLAFASTEFRSVVSPDIKGITKGCFGEPRDKD